MPNSKLLGGWGCLFESIFEMPNILRAPLVKDISQTWFALYLSTWWNCTQTHYKEGTRLEWVYRAHGVVEVLARKTGSMAAVVFAVKTMFGWNFFLVLMNFHLQRERLACKDRFTAINSGQIRGSAVQVTANVRRLRGCKVEFESSDGAETLPWQITRLVDCQKCVNVRGTGGNIQGLSALTC